MVVRQQITNQYREYSSRKIYMISQKRTYSGSLMRPLFSIASHFIKLLINPDTSELGTITNWDYGI